MGEQCSAFIDRLIEQRHRQGLTQKQLAQQSQLTQSVIARLERKRAVPQLDTLIRVASALGCRVELVEAKD